MRDFNLAQKCFDENLAFFTSTAPSAPPDMKEKYNLYVGLGALAEALSYLEGRVRRMEEVLNRLSR